MSFRKASISAFFWSSGQQISVLLVNLVVSIWLSRLLDPVEFGLIGMLSIFIAVGSVLMNGGMASSIIRTQEINSKALSTVFFANVAFSVLIYLIFYISAPWIASFYNRPILTDLLRVYSLVILIAAFSTVQFAKLTKELRFKRSMAVRFPAVILSAFVGLWMAYSGYKVWSLVGMYLTQAIFNSMLVWFYSGWKPKLEFSRLEFKRHFSFGAKISFSGLLDAVYTNSYNLVIGKVFNAHILGYYTRSFSLMKIPVFNIQEVFDRVTFPLLSTIQNDTTKLRNTYRRIFQSILLIILPILSISIVIAEPLFRYFLTEKWLPAVPYFQLLCVAGMFIPTSKNNLNILKVRGQGGTYLKLGMIEKAFMTLGLFLVLPFGVMALLYFQVGAALFSFAINGWFSGKQIHYTLVQQLRDFLKIFLLAATPGLVIWLFLNNSNYLQSDFLIILFATIFYVLSYGILLLLFEKSILRFMKDTLKPNR
ncbi:MAG TPA: lipopolysaccharide biosynthesis protein [Flavobacteriaceae bacterium]|nr:lipopolysaccharide biosynthesis protein [Flavobacteriaceae bacterium]MCB9213487.1 lipopolysaccharide biosynthesis protein [Alteromonas sp.]HPF12210.1 lipopolysaccharide biosynthesis protein [Flavobacteriaceae bacterium]HQU22003.1 lipopolysaccharide biosynthesis protein [Flavobacteriaceae bacterium]HQU65902.1 lipopolysaccharide biosynthesis protein [Flavobacteriaceae bacterium]